MTILANKPTLLITVTCPARLSPEFTKTVEDFRAKLNEKNTAITWLAESPKKLLATKIPSKSDEVGLAGSSSLSTRQEIATAIRTARHELDSDARQLSTVAEEDCKLWEHGDLLAKAGCSAVLSAAHSAATRKATFGKQVPKRGRFGLWIVPITRTLRTQRDVSQATRNLAADLASGLVHLSISGAAPDALRQSLSGLASEIRSQAAGRCHLTSVSELTRAWASGVRSQPAQSILRKAA